jgi:hypothetical protein
MAQLILLLMAGYAGVGALFGIAFITIGAARIDHAAQGAPWTFRLLIWPGATALWPLLLSKWMRSSRGERP